MDKNLEFSFKKPFDILLQPEARSDLHGRQDLNLEPAVLETAALPVELRPYVISKAGGETRGLPINRHP